MLALFVIALLATRAAGGDFLNSAGQAEVEHGALDDANRCNDCHADGTKDIVEQKCLDCHDHRPRARGSTGKGFHASPLVKGKRCQTCHTEHHGRGFDIMGWKNIPGGQKGFDHKLTGWKLNGKHATTDCDDCHKKSDKQGLKTYMGTDRLCGACHLKEQPHKFEASEKDKLACERCHSEAVWKPAKALSRRSSITTIARTP